MDSTAPHTRVESGGRIGAPGVTVGYAETAARIVSRLHATMTGTFLLVTTVQFIELVPSMKAYINHRYVPKQ